jgi:ATP phosphoribosyltransferase
MGECDAFTDITETGATLKANGNNIVAELFTSNPQLIANKEGIKDAALLEKMEDIRICLDAVLQAEREPVYMVFMDVPTKVLAQVEKMLPSVISPTVSPVIDDSWCSVSVVIRESQLNILAPQLQRIGVDGIVPIPAPKVFTQDMVKANKF